MLCEVDFASEEVFVSVPLALVAVVVPLASVLVVAPFPVLAALSGESASLVAAATAAEAPVPVTLVAPSILVLRPSWISVFKAPAMAPLVGAALIQAGKSVVSYE